MKSIILKYQDWEFEVDKESNLETYSEVLKSGTEDCNCNDCKNYIAQRDKIFPQEIRQLFTNLGIDYKKEVEITNYETLESGLHHIAGWFHFKGRILKGKDCRIPVDSNGFTIDLTKIEDNFSIGFTIANDLTFFKNKDRLVQLEFDTNIPWIIGKNLESK